MKDESFLIANYEYMSDTLLAELLPYSKTAIIKRAKEMGLKHLKWTVDHNQCLWENMSKEITWEELSERVEMPEQSVRHRMDELGWSRV